MSGRRKLSAIVVDRIKQMVIDGAFMPGDAIPSEADLAEEFNVSKPTIREAIDQLSMLGIISVRQGKQSVVNDLNSSALEEYFRFAVNTYETGLVDTMELRRAIEVENAALAAARIDEEGARRLDGIVERMAACIDSPDDWLDADYQFHLAIAELTRNAMLLQVFNGIEQAVRYMQRIVHSRREMRLPAYTLQIHKDIVVAIKSGNTARAREIMHIHCSGGLPILKAIIAEKAEQKEVRS